MPDRTNTPADDAAIKAILQEMAWGQDCRDDAVRLLRAIEVARNAAALAEELGTPRSESTSTGFQEAFDKLADEVTRLQTLINTPELSDFDKGVPLECAHQIERWGDAHDRSKSAENWYWLVGYLAGKALRASVKGDREKALHHTISAAAGLRNWHRAIQQDTTGAGIGQDADLEAIEAPLEEFKR